LGKEKIKTDSMTFRIEKDIMQKLREDAKNKGISLNTFINQIIRNFLDWYIFEPKIGMIPISKPVVVELFHSLTKEEISNIASNVGKSAIYDITLFMKSKVDIDSFLQWFELRVKNSPMQLYHTVNGKIHIYTIKHDICINWSYYYKVILERIFNEVFNKNVEINISEGSFTVAFEK
jgi:hypothetical protein